MSDMSVFAPAPLTYALLLPGETHLHSAVLAKAVSNRLFLFTGPTLYGIEPGAVRYWAHLTDQRLLMEVCPYSKAERAVLNGAMFLMGALFSNPQLKAQLVTQKIMIKVNEAREGDPNAQYMAIPYDRLKATCFKNTVTNFVKLEITGINEEMVFVPQLRIEEGKIMPSGKLADNIKKAKDLAPRFVQLCQGLIDMHQKEKRCK